MVQAEPDLIKFIKEYLVVLVIYVIHIDIRLFIYIGIRFIGNGRTYEV